MKTEAIIHPENIDDQYDQYDQYDPKGMDTYDYKQKSSRIRRALWFCAGVDEQVMQKCPHSERVKAEGMGGIVLATAILAFASSSYAFYIVFGPKVGLVLSPEQQNLDVMSMLAAIVCGFIWALIIFNLDRFIVTSTGHGDGTSSITWAELGHALPRLGMAAVIGITLSAPLEVRVFQSEIEAALQVEQQDFQKERNKDALGDKILSEQKKAENDIKIKGVKQQLQRGRDKLQTLENHILDVENKLENEATTGNGQGDRGIGPIYKALDAKLKHYTAQLEEEKSRWATEEPALKQEMIGYEEDSNVFRQKYEQRLESIKRNTASVDGLGKRIELAHSLFPVAGYMLMALLMLIEIAPVLIKMMLIRGPYDMLSDNQNKLVQAKYAIEDRLTHSTDENKKHNEYLEQVYHQPETILSFEYGKLKVESNLATAAQDAFEAQVRQEIQRHPEKYIAGYEGMPPASQSSL